MRIKRLDIMGFKSFPERVQVPFPAGISAVVGPNGCGKSNIVDSIRWVMGEQSAKQLRGRNMEDILFNGAQNHSPAAMAEVTLLLSNENGHGPGVSLGPSEISITRRLYRSGDSEYLINRVPCRLKDVTQFFMDTGMGTKAYAIIEQGRIGWLVDARPEERRALIDEAAGITRYKAQKREAERKIEATEQNMTHISAVMAETKRQINALTRAAGKAARYKELKAELKEVDLVLAVSEVESLRSRRIELEAAKGTAETRLAGLLTELDRVEVELEDVRLGIVEREKDAEAKAAALHQLQNRFTKLKEEDKYNRRESEETEARQVRLSEEVERLGGQRARQAEEIEELREELSSLRRAVDEKRADVESLRRSYADLKREYDLAVGRRDEAGRELSEAKSRRARLEQVIAGHARMAENYAARREEVGEEASRLRFEADRLNEEIGTLEERRDEDRARIEETKVRAAASREQISSGRAEADRLTAQERAIHSELTGLKSKLATLKEVQANFGWYPEGVQALMADPAMREAGVLGPVAERVSVPAGFENAVEAALGERLKYILVRDRSAAITAIGFLNEKNLGRCGFISLADLNGTTETDLTRALLGDFDLYDDLDQAAGKLNGRSVLTRAGDYVGIGGLVVGGRGKGGDKGLLARLKDIEGLEERTGRLSEEAGRLEALKAEAIAAVDSRRAELAEVEEMGRSHQAAAMEVEKRLSSLGGRRGEIEGRIGQVARSLDNLAAEEERLVEERESALAEKDGLEADEFGLRSGLEDAEERARVLEADLEQARETGQAASVEMSSMNERLQNADREMARTSEWLAELDRQAEAKEEDLGRAGDDLERLAARRTEIAGQFEGFAERLAEAEDEVNRGKALVDELRSASNLKENEARQARRQRSEVDENIRKMELDLQEIGFRRRALLEKFEAEYHLDPEDLPEEERPEPPEEFDSEAAVKKRDDLRSKIEGMGEVNLTAINEHDALMERYNFYKTQYEDLESAVKNLRDSINRINRTCKIRFSSTFQAVDEKLREIFPLLFEGGEAWLTLTDDADPLESGVEIHVHPPGKKLTVMSLLSGGEKALVALALIFALYLIKPSPFCLLDETDAPLDEANIDRFNRLLTKLGQSSQIIMVTHNKRTMQISQTLYGVTMEEPGISKMVSVSLSELEEMIEDDKLVQAG